MIHIGSGVALEAADSVVDVAPYYHELDAAGRAQAESLFMFVQGVVAEADNRSGIEHQPPNIPLGVTSPVSRAAPATS